MTTFKFERFKKDMHKLILGQGLYKHFAGWVKISADKILKYVSYFS